MNSRRLTLVLVTIVLVLLLHISIRLETENARYFSGRITQSQVSLAQERGKVVSVRAFGAKGNGTSDDTAAIQAAINAAQAGETIYFPPGIYDVSNFVVKNRSHLSFTGEGQKSVIRQKTGAGRIATIDSSRDIVIANLTFDANGIQAFGGVALYAVAGIRIENNTFIDSAQRPWGRQDRASFNFARGHEPSRDINISNNTIEDLQLDFAHSQRVIVDRNVIRRGGKTAGIGIYTVRDNSIAEDFQITNNTVIDPIGAGFNIVIDAPTDGHCIFRRITLDGNQMIRTTTAGYGILIGTPNNSIQSTGNVFENIVINNNRLRVESSAPRPFQSIFANSSDQAGIVFKRLTVSANTIENESPNGKGYPVDLRRIQESFVIGNTVKGGANGISLAGELLSNELRNNIVETNGIAYALEGSLGKNRAANNRFVGNSSQPWKLSKLQPSDSIER